MNYQKKFVVYISVITVALLLLAFFLTEPLSHYEHLIWPLTALCLIFGITSLANGLFLFRYAKKRPQAFIRGFMGSFTLRFFINLIVLGSYLYMYPIGRIPIVIVFFTLFILYTVLEKVLVLQAFRSSEGV